MIPQPQRRRKSAFIASEESTIRHGINRLTIIKQSSFHLSRYLIIERLDDKNLDQTTLNRIQYILPFKIVGCLFCIPGRFCSLFHFSSELECTTGVRLNKNTSTKHYMIS
jgi:hypothetical protein